MATYALRNGSVRKLKADVTWEYYSGKYPDAIQTKKPPSITTLKKWDSNGNCKAIDGCKVEPDGTCPHGSPSWLLAMGLI